MNKSTIQTRSADQKVVGGLPVDERAFLERGMNYLKRFKTLSKAYATGELRNFSRIPPQQESSIPGTWQNVRKYIFKLLEYTNLKKV